MYNMKYIDKEVSKIARTSGRYLKISKYMYAHLKLLVKVQ